jgi:hypothetical protein
MRKCAIAARKKPERSFCTGRSLTRRQWSGKSHARLADRAGLLVANEQ